MHRVFAHRWHLVTGGAFALSFGALGCNSPATSAPPGPSPSSSASAAAQSAPKADEPQAPETFDIAAIDAYVAHQAATKGHVGLSLAILDGGKIVFAKGYGQRSREPAAPVEAETAFAIGSVTKQFTCASLLLLSEAHKLSLNDKVSKYYPDLTRAGDITLDDLGAHVSGYPDYYPLDFVDRRFFESKPTDQVIDTYAKTKLDFEPRSRWSYSNTGFLILGRVVEKTSGGTFGDFLQNRIFTPVGMTHSHYQPKDGTPGIAKGYTSVLLGEPSLAAREAPGWIDAAGAMYASASDLLRWDLALIDGKVLTPDSYKTMTTPRTLSTGRSTHYGCGIGVGRVAGETVLRHTGGVGGFVTYNSVFPRTRSGVVLLSNREDVDARPIHDMILGLLAKERVSEIPKVPGKPPKEMARELWSQLKSGTLDRNLLGKDFSEYMTDSMLREGKERLTALGDPTSIDVESVGERGGMEVSSIKLTFATKKVRAVLARSTDGKVQQFLLSGT